MKLLDPAGYRRTPWKNGGGVSVEIAAEHDPALGEDWKGLVWSLSRTGFAGPSPFSDLSGMDRIIAVVGGVGLTLRAWDGGADVVVGPPFQPTPFDGGRRVDGVPDGAVTVANVMGRRAAVRIGLRFLHAGDRARVVADVVLLHACAGAVRLSVDGAARTLGEDAALRADGAALDVAVSAGVLLVATVARNRGG
jgi:environmental stress-induced protein Ves